MDDSKSETNVNHGEWVVVHYIFHVIYEKVFYVMDDKVFALIDRSD
jgi:hypothetical protein